MDDLNLAVYMHNKYEEISQKVNWKTQKSCRQKSFHELPRENQQVMLGLAADLNFKFNSQEKLASEWIAKLQNQTTDQKKAIEVLLMSMPREFLIKALAELHDRRFRDLK